jgi:hypothetical protein
LPPKNYEKSCGGWKGNGWGKTRNTGGWKHVVKNLLFQLIASTLHHIMTKGVLIIMSTVTIYSHKTPNSWKRNNHHYMAAVIQRI